MSDPTAPKPGPSNSPSSSSTDTSSSGSTSGDQSTKVTSAAQPTQQARGGEEGVQVGGLEYTTNEDGTRDYPAQEPVQTIDDPTPQPEQVDAEAPRQTNQQVGQ